MLLPLFYATIILGGCALSRAFDRRRVSKAPEIPQVDMGAMDYSMPSFVTVAPYDTVYYFDQPIDHDGPSKGTFKQRHWHRAEFYNEGLHS